MGTIRLWLSRLHDGRYVFSSLPPVRAVIAGSKRETFYPQHGEPIWTASLCPSGIHQTGIRLEKMETRLIQISFTGTTENENQ